MSQKVNCIVIIVMAHLLSVPSAGTQIRNKKPIHLRCGPHLFVDEFLIATKNNIVRQVNCPIRDLPGPVVTGKEDKCFQPYMTVIRDAQSGRFRLWYGVPESANQSHVGYMESQDGIHWIRPHRVLQDPALINFGISIIDEGADYRNRSRRFKFGWYADKGLKVASSPDGLLWKSIVPGVVLEHNHDINNIFRDTPRNRYIAMVSTVTTGDKWSGNRRVIMQSASEDLVHWEKPWLVITPDDKIDEGDTQFYCMGGLLARGDLLIGMVRVLRDDLPADPGGPVAGIGYTTLAWSRDEKHWTWDRKVFFDRNKELGTWDHAMAWIDCQLPVGNQIYIYYGGYARGHKIERFTERQIGLVRMKQDRYVAWQAGDDPGTLITPSVVLAGEQILLNADADGGEIRVQIAESNGKPIPGFTFADCIPMTSDAVAEPVRWRHSRLALAGREVRLEFALRRARLFAFELK